MRIIAGLVLTCVLGFAGMSAQAASPYPDHPPSAGLVNDFAGVLSPSEKAGLESDLRGFEKKTGAEFVVAIVKSFGGQTPFDYAHGLFHTWGIGKRGADNGVLLVVSTGDKEARIEVGTRLEPLLTDLDSKMILHNVLHPAYKSGQQAKGIIDTAHTVIDKLSPGLTVEGKDIMSHATPKKTSGSNWVAVAILLLIGVAAVIILMVVSSRRPPTEEEPEEEVQEPSYGRRTYAPTRRAPITPTPERTARDDDSGFVAGAVTGALLDHEIERPEPVDDPEPDDSDGPAKDDSDGGFSLGGGDDEGGGADESLS